MADRIVEKIIEKMYEDEWSWANTPHEREQQLEEALEMLYNKGCHAGWWQRHQPEMEVARKLLGRKR